MANSKQATKRARQSIERRTRNRANRSRLRTRMKGFQKLAAAGGEGDALRAELARTLSMIDKAVHKGILHPNNAARKKSSLMRRTHRTIGTAS